MVLKVFSASIAVAIFSTLAACSTQEAPGLLGGEHRGFADALERTDLQQALEEPGRAHTLLVPSDDAMAAARERHPELFADDDRLAFVTKLHLATGAVDVDDLAELADDGKGLATHAGLALAVTADADGTIRIDGHRVTRSRRDGASVVHEIEGVIVPPEGSFGG